MIFRSFPTKSGYIFSGIALIFGTAAVYMLSLWPQLTDWPARFNVTIGAIAMLTATVTALYGAVIAFKLRYQLNRNGLIIQWGLTRHQIPFNSIEAILPGATLPETSRLKTLNIAGLHMGRGELADYGPVKIFTTAPPAGSLLVVAHRQAYLISPQTPDQFITAWQARRQLGPTQRWAQGITRNWPLNIPWLTDRLTWGLFGPAALIYLGLFGYVASIFAQLPPSLPIHFNALGRADRIADKSALFTLLIGGGLVLVINLIIGALLYNRGKIAAYLLWAITILVQISLGIALQTIMA
jgi:hypothetical protein